MLELVDVLQTNTTAIDLTSEIGIVATILVFVDQLNTAAIYITHDLAVVAQMSDVIKVLLTANATEEADTALQETRFGIIWRRCDQSQTKSRS